MASYVPMIHRRVQVSGSQTLRSFSSRFGVNKSYLCSNWLVGIWWVGWCFRNFGSWRAFHSKISRICFLIRARNPGPARLNWATCVAITRGEFEQQKHRLWRPWNWEMASICVFGDSKFVMMLGGDSLDDALWIWLPCLYPPVIMAYPHISSIYHHL